MNPIAKYLQETRAELRHVAWPTRMQTIVYTVLVALFSVGVSLYLGLFDFIFTTTLTRVISILPAAQTSIQVEQAPAGSTGTAPLAPIESGKLQIVPTAEGTTKTK